MCFLKVLLIFGILYLNSINAKLVENHNKVPRIMYWPGNVNNRIDETTGWEFQTDPDGVSGANINKLAYCRKFYPLTFKVLSYDNETSKNWYSAGNIRHPGYDYCVDTVKFESFECRQPYLNNPRIMYLSGKVNQHTSYTTGWRWVSDSDSVSGAEIPPLVYCKKLFPATVTVEQYIREDISSWVDIGGASGSCGGSNASMQCIQRENFDSWRGVP